jgi:H+/gluconate symporter-like permease
MAWLMYGRRISALLALPIMAIILALVGGVPGKEILDEIIAKGAVKLNVTYTTTMFGAMLAELINRLGIARSLIRWVAEFAGDNPFVLSLLMTFATAVLFSTLGGLGAVIMVGTIILPIMLSIGVSNATAGGLFLFGISLGGMFNIAGWQLYMDVLGIPREQIVTFVVPFALIISCLIIAFLTIELKQKKSVMAALFSLAGLLACFVFVQGGLHSRKITGQSLENAVSARSIPICFVALIVLIAYAFIRHRTNKTNSPGFVMLTPLVPLVLVLLGHWDFIPAFIAGIAFASLGSWRRDSINTLNRAIIDGISAVIPAVVLMMGIGMLINAVRHPMIAQSIAPLLSRIIPTTAWQYVLVFSLIAPLSLYRGPLSIWGMGSGIVSLIQKATTLSSQAIMGMLMSVGQIQGVCDPTNTQNIWIANYLGTDTQILLRKTIPYAWLAVVCGLLLVTYSGYVL